MLQNYAFIYWYIFYNGNITLFCLYVITVFFSRCFFSLNRCILGICISVSFFHLVLPLFPKECYPLLSPMCPDLTSVSPVPILPSGPEPHIHLLCASLCLHTPQESISQVPKLSILFISHSPVFSSFSPKFLLSFVWEKIYSRYPV